MLHKMFLRCALRHLCTTRLVRTHRARISDTKETQKLENGIWYAIGTILSLLLFSSLQVCLQSEILSRRGTQPKGLEERS